VNAVYGFRTCQCELEELNPARVAREPFWGQPKLNGQAVFRIKTRSGPAHHEDALQQDACRGQKNKRHRRFSDDQPAAQSAATSPSGGLVAGLV
jgi:hypothetical protein